MTSTSITLEEEQQRKRIKDFFYDESVLPCIVLPTHAFEQSPCRVMIMSEIILDCSNPGYYCKLHPQIYYFLHLEKLMATLRQSVLDRVAGYKSQHGGISITRRFYVVVIEQICLLSIWLCQTKYKRRCM